MTEKTDKPEKSTVCIDIPKALYDRVEAYSRSHNIQPGEFIFDAVSEKLASVHKERRRKLRL